MAKPLNRVVIISCFLLIGALKFFSINYGNPYLLHPDEPYLYKDPLKLIYNYSQGDFSSPSNPFFWVVPVWYGIVFLIGLIIREWHDLNEFKELLVLEDFSIIYCGRLLSIIFSLLGSYFVFKIVNRLSLSFGVKTLLLLGVLLNPFEVISNVWFKFDAACYFYTCFLLYKIISYHGVESLERKKLPLYLLLFIGPAIRIDLVSFLLSYMIFELFKKYNYNIISFLKNRFIILLCGMGLYLIITLLPLSLFSPVTYNTILVEKTFQEAITLKTTESIAKEEIFENITKNFYFYFVFCICTVLPVLAYILIKEIKALKYKWLLINIGILSIPLLIFQYNAPHYFLIISTILIILLILNTPLFTSKQIYILSFLHLCCISTITILFFVSILTKSDPRIKAKGYLLHNTIKGEAIAMEGYINLGQTPPLDECPDVLSERSAVTKKLRMGSGESLLLKAKYIDTSECRTIIDVSYPQRFNGTEYENIWNIPYDTLALKNASPEYFVSYKNYAENKGSERNKFNNFISSAYVLHKSFEINFWDKRLEKLMHKENYLVPVYIFKRKNI